MKREKEVPIKTKSPSKPTNRQTKKLTIPQNVYIPRIKGMLSKTVPLPACRDGLEKQ